MSGPWEKYGGSQQPVVEAAPIGQSAGPWNKYGGSSNVELPPFPVDAYVDQHVKDLAPDKQIEQRDGLTKFFSSLADPWMATGYTAASSINRGMAQMSDTFDLLTKFISRETGMERGGLFEKAAQQYNENADYWKERADKVGVGFLEELLGEAVGGAVPGITDFALKVASGFSIPAVAGAEKSMEHDQDPFIGGLIEAAKTGTLYGVFKMIQPFSRYIQATMMGGTFALEGGMTAPEGQKLKEAAKGFGTGLLFSGLSSPGGVKIRDIYPEIGRTVPEFRKELESESQPTPAEEIVQPEQTSQADTAEKPKKEGEGPGAALSGSRDFDPDIERLTDFVKQMPKDSSFEDRTKAADEIKKHYEGALAKTKEAWDGLKNFSIAAKDWYMRGPSWTNFENAFGEYIGAREKTQIKVGRFAKQMQKSMPERKQNAISNYMRAGGDESIIREWADKTEDTALKQGYEDALTLTDKEKELARDFHRYWDRKLDEAIEEGVLTEGVENYVRQILSKNPKDEVAKNLLNRATSGKLNQNPSFAKKQIFHSFFEGEQAGYRYEKRIGALISEYQLSFDEAINARRFVREQLSKMDATDGRPMVVTQGVGKPIMGKDAEGKPTEIPEAFLIRPEAVSETKDNLDTSDYKVIPNAYALKKYKWATKDSEGKPIFVEGDLKIHPEAYDQMNALLGRSLIQDYELAGIQPGKLALKGSSAVKGTLLGFFATFHQTHIGARMATRAVSPFKPPEIDLNDTVTSDLIDHNLKVYDGNPMSMFRQGYEGPGLIKMIPKLGKYAEQYTEYLFGLDGYIPRMKVKLANEFFERNTEHYSGKLSRDQILKLSAEQANAAIGGQNWEAMGTSKTAQDLMRLAGLAPDFLVSSWRAKGQAFKPYGREQFAAIALRGTIMLYATAKIIEGIASMIDGKNDVHWDRPFSVTIDETEYSIRSEQGDIQHAMSDPRGFIYNRLNPAIVKPAIEYVTGRDRFGRKRDTLEVLQDWITGAVPIAGQGYFTKDDWSLYQSVLQSVGISSWDAETDAERTIKELKKEEADMVKKQKAEIDKQLDPEARKMLKGARKMFTIRGQQ